MYILFVILVIVVILYFATKKTKALPSSLNEKSQPSKVEAITIEDFEAANESLKKYKKNFSFEIRGLQIDEYKKRIIKCKLFDIVSLGKEPDNKYDTNAVSVMAPSGRIGYVPREKTEKVHKVIDGGDYLAVLYKIYISNNYYIDASVRIYHNLTLKNNKIAI